MTREQTRGISHKMLELMQERYVLHKFKPDESIPKQVLMVKLTVIIRSNDELSILAPVSVQLHSQNTESGWRGIRVVGPLDFNEIGILAGLSAVLAEQRIPILAVSSFETDYLFVKSEHIDQGIAALERAGYRLQNHK